MKLKYFSLTALLFLLCFFSLSAQYNLSNIKPRNIGPAGMSGRVTAIDAIVSQPEVIYAGTASGGLWRSTSGGTTWQAIFDSCKSMAVGAVKIYQKNPSNIWLGTGEGNPRNSQSSGIGIYKSIDGGRTWEHKGLDSTRNIHRIILHNENKDLIIVGAQGDAWADSKHRGVYLSTDGGNTWKNTLYVNQSTGIAEIVQDPTNPDKLIAAMWDYRRKPWHFRSGGVGSGLYMSLDFGTTWQKFDKRNGLPDSELGRIGLAIAPSMPSRVYALVEAKENAMYRSDDGGFNWSKIKSNNVGGRPFYYAEIYVDPSNENRIYNIHSVVDVSEDAGKTFETFIGYYTHGVHPDHHAWWIHPSNTNYIIDGNDGGLAITHDKGKSWHFAENIPVAQFYHINYDMQLPYNVYGGMQDNGSWRGPSSVWRQGGIRNSYWDEIMFGDGFDVVPDQSNENFGYAMWQEGNLGRVDFKTGHSKNIKPVTTDSTALRFHWNSALAHDPFDKQTIYFGSQFVHKSKDRGENWKIISPDLTTNDPEKLVQDTSGGLTPDVTSAENHCTILAISPSPIKKDMIWVSTDDGKLHLTQDNGATWNDLSKGLTGLPQGSWIPFVFPSPHQVAEAFVVANNYRRGDWEPYLFHTKDYGKTWVNLARGKNIDSYVLSFVQDHLEPNLMFMGTEFGLYFSLDYGKNWQKWTRNYPNVSTIDLKIHPRDNDLIIGTFGRAAWIIDDISFMRNLVKKPTKPLTILSASDGIQVSLKQAPGMRFAGNSIYSGANKMPYPRIVYHIDSTLYNKKADSINKFDNKLTWEVYQNGDLVRKNKIDADSIISFFYWDMNKQGVRNPMSPKPSEEQYIAGFPALPGNYQIKISYKGHSDSAQVSIQSDPRLDINFDNLVQRSIYLDSINLLNASMTEDFDKLRKAEKIVDIIQNIATLQDSSSKSQIDSLNKAIRADVESIYETYRGKKESKGIVRRADVVSNNIGNCQWYLLSSYDAINSNQLALFNTAKQGVNSIQSQVVEFEKTKWQQYIDKPLIKSLKVIQLLKD